MLAEWYFCCCISANPSDTEAFLSILQCLNDSESEPQLLYLVFNELGYTDDRMQIYALPRVLRLLHKDNLPTGLKQIIRQYFNHLLENVPEGVDRSVRKLTMLVDSQLNSTKLLKAVDIFVRESQSLPDRRLSPTPYIDLKDFLSETFVLAILANCLEQNASLSNALAEAVNDQDGISSPISELLQAALEYQFGRMAFRLAVLIFSLTAIEYPQDIRSLTANKVSAAPHVEPDLLQTYAVALFGKLNLKHNASNQCRRILHESQTLGELRNLLQSNFRENSGEVDLLLRRVGLQSSPTRRQSLPIFYWQIVLWELSSQINAEATADWLSRVWLPGPLPPVKRTSGRGKSQGKNNKQSRELRINCTLTDSSEHFKAQFKSLLEIQKHPPIELKVVPKTGFNRYDKFAWLFLSPWITRTTKHISYPASDEPVLLIRLIGSVYFAIHLLKKLAQNNAERVEFAARFIAHASDIMALLERRWNKCEIPKIESALMGLFRFSQQQIKRVGTGQIESIDPQIFVSICDRRQSLSVENSNFKSEESLFLNSVLSEVLIAWILDAYPSAVNSQLTGRWLSLIPSIYEHHISGNHPFVEQQKATLVTRLLCPNYSLRLDGNLDWRNQRDKRWEKGENWKVYPRQLLLTQQLHPNEWRNSEWDERVDWGEDHNREISSRLVYYLELLASIGQTSSNEDKDDKKENEQIFYKWKKCLNSIGNIKNFDRLVRLRLLEFLDSPVLRGHFEEQFFLASVLLEYGSIYDLKHLFERVYPIATDGISLQETEPARQQLQTELLPMMGYRLDQYRELMQEIGHETDHQNQARKAQNPHETHRRLKDIELCQEWLNKLLYLSSIPENHDDFGGLFLSLKNLRQAALTKRSTTFIRSATFNVELRQARKRLVPTDNYSPSDLTIRGINYNPNQLTATVFFEDFDMSEVENLFEKEFSELPKIGHDDNAYLDVLGIVVNAVKAKNKKDSKDRWNYTFDCGFHFLLGPFPYHKIFNIGDRVKLPIRLYPSKSGDKPEWGIDYKKEIKPLNHSFEIGDINKINVSETWKEMGLRLFSLEHNQKNKPLRNEDLPLWDADTSRIFHSKTHFHNRSVFAQLNSQKRWTPLDLEFNDLLSQIVHSHSTNQITVLTLIEETINQFGAKAWRFSRQPGENYLIEQCRFLGDAAATIEEEITRYDTRDGAFGLLVSLMPDCVADQVGLKLVTYIMGDDLVNDFYPNLSVPFDDRNIRWRELFNQFEEGLEIRKDQDSNWFYQIPDRLVVSGYPRQLKVHFSKNKSPRFNQKIADFIVTEWNNTQWRRGFVVGEAVQSYSIRPQNKDWAAFLERWLALPERQHIRDRNPVKITRLLGDIDQEGDGFVAGWTSENMFVRVQAESLTMLPLDIEKIQLPEERNAEILQIDWNNIEIDADIEIEKEESKIPPEAIQNHQCVGILSLVSATRETHGTQCQVVWRVKAGNVREQPLQINNLAELRIRQGCKIIGTEKQGHWTFEIQKPTIRVRALWTLKSWQQGELSDLYYLGTVVADNGKDLAIAESPSCPGQLICLPSDPQETFHLAKCEETKTGALNFIENSLWEEKRAKNTARHRYADDEPYRSGYQRAILKLGNRLLTGNYNQWIDSNDKVSVQTVELVFSSRDDQQYTLRRRFNLRSVRDIKKQIKNSELSNIKRWEKNLNSYLRTPEPLRATFAEEQSMPGFLLFSGINEIRVPVDASRREWRDWVPLAPEYGPFVTGADYSTQAKIILIPEDDRIMASCRKIPHLDLENFRINYCESSPFDTDIFLRKNKDIRLYYVGPETVDPITREPYAEISHRFEMGYGETLLIPESKLEFNDDTFDKAQFSLFYGDQIKVISFKRIGAVESESEEPGLDQTEFEKSTSSRLQQTIILNIKGIYVQWSDARQLFEQRKRYQIVHLLHLDPQSETPEISYIDGFNESSIAPQQRFEPKKFRAFLTPDSEARIAPRIRNWAEDSDPVIYGKLDENRYRQSHGRDIYFEHVRLSFQSIEGEESSSLQNGDLVFLRAGEIKPIKNDMRLMLRPPKGFDPIDIGEDTKKLVVFRRNFSVRENLLNQVYQEKGEKYFQDDPLLIKLNFEFDSKHNDKGRIFSSLLIKGSQIPTRKMSALASAISYHNKAGLLATVVQVNIHGTVQIEYKPGIFIRLESDQIQSCPDDLLPGAMVRIDIVDNMLNIARAVFSHAQYVPEKTRLVVILPTNEIQRLDPKNWARQSRFVIGGLSNLIAYSGYPTKENWQKLLSRQAITELLTTQHPKLAQLSVNNKGKYFVAPLADHGVSGYLKRIEDSLVVQYASLNSTSLENSASPDPQPKPVLPWHLLSFADESAHQILDRSTAYSWKYHDETTFTWLSDAEKFQSEKLQEHSVWTGPLFFQATPKGLRLRYTSTEFRRFGFPVDELIAALKQEPQVQHYPVAGVSQSDVLDSEKPEYSLWIELAPGRLIELPTQLIFWQSGISDKYQSLADVMYWQGFAPGDYVELELISTDPLTIDRILLRSWISGIRHALGPKRCFLPIAAMDEQQGELSLGHGNMMLKLPFANADPNWQMVILTAENDIHGLQAVSQSLNAKPSPQPVRDDVVLLGIGEQDKVVVLGFEGIHPLPERKGQESARNHPITRYLRWSREGLKNWIRAAGGALPVTVEWLNQTQDQKRLYFSMRHQQDIALIPRGRASLARFVDLLPDQKNAMLYCSGGLITLPMHLVVSGLDPSLYSDAATALKQAQVSLWLRREQNGRFELGLYNDSETLDLWVESLDILLGHPTEDQMGVGLICQSTETKTLHWFPLQESAWTKLSVEEFREIFRARGSFKVRRKSNHYRNLSQSVISLLAEPDVYSESKTLAVGKELFVQVLQCTQSITSGTQRYLVESVATQAILSCEIYNDQLLYPGDTLSVEVVSHIKGRPELITVAPVGTKRKYLDLPKWMTQTLPEPGDQRRGISDYIRWRKRSPIVREYNTFTERDNIREGLNKLLCSYFNDAYGTLNKQDGLNAESPEKQMQIAQLWEQQNRYKSEVYAAFPIMAILLLHQHEETKHQAYKLALNLGQRALRSLHIEILYEKWLRRADDRKRGYGLWQRLEQLYSEGHFSVPLQSESSDAIKQFCNSAEMKDDQNILPIAQSLSVALGDEASSIEKLSNPSSVTMQLINLYLTLHPDSKIKLLQVYHIQKLKEILVQIDNRKLDIMLLEPLEQQKIIDSHSVKSLEEIDLLSELFPQSNEEDWFSWKLQQVSHLDDLTEQSILLQQRVSSLSNRVSSLNDWFHWHPHFGE